MKRGTLRTIALAAGLSAGVLAVSSVLAEEIWVKSETAEIRSGKGAVFPLVATAEKGAKLTVIAREPKGWIKVKAGDKEGFVYENSISAQEVKGGGNLFAAMGAGAGASGMTEGAAGRNLTQETKDYAATTKLDPALLDKVIASNKTINPQEWQAFTAEGKVGPNAP